ncbi:MAG: RNA 2',3'-cyclic phosphodiesterase [Betaproteobacteria bacterium]
MPRLFFALWPSPDVRSRLVEQRDVAVRDYRGRPMRPDTLHMTLAFLGETPELRVPVALGCGDRVRGKCFNLHIDARAHFPDAKVAWLGCADPPGALQELWMALGEELRGAQFPFEGGDSAIGYQPHITVARDCLLFPSPKGLPAIEWPVEDFVLVDSTRTPGGPVYRVLRHWQLES